MDIIDGMALDFVVDPHVGHFRRAILTETETCNTGSGGSPQLLTAHPQLDGSKTD